MENCKAAQFNPTNACTDRCKWPGACVNGAIRIPTIEDTKAILDEIDAKIEQEASEEAASTEATPAEPVKKKPGRPKKAQ